MGEIKKRLPLKCPACDAPLREIHFGPAPNPVWLVLCGRASDSVENAARKCAEILNCLCWHGFQIKSSSLFLRLSNRAEV